MGCSEGKLSVRTTLLRSVSSQIRDTQHAEGRIIDQSNKQQEYTDTISSLWPQLKHKIKSNALLLVWVSHSLVLVKILPVWSTWKESFIAPQNPVTSDRVAMGTCEHQEMCSFSGHTQKFPSFPRIRYLLSVLVVNYCVACLCFDYHENYTLELSALWFSVCLTKEVNEIISGSPVCTAAV